MVFFQRRQMRRNLWLPFQLTLVSTLCVGVGVRTTNVLSIDRHMIDQRALFYRSIGIWLINGLCLTTSFVATQSSIDQKKILNLTWFLWFSDISNRKRLIVNSRAKRLHTPGETTSDSGRIDSGSGRNDDDMIIVLHNRWSWHSFARWLRKWDKPNLQK